MISISSLQSMYAYGTRCPKLIKLMVMTSVSGVGPGVCGQVTSLFIPSQPLLRRVAEYIFIAWELDPNGQLIKQDERSKGNHLNSPNQLGASDDQSVYEHRLNRLQKYITVLVTRVKPHLLSLLLATQVIGRLRAAHPAARGEPGCAHRLFVVGLMLSMKYIELDGELMRQHGLIMDTLSQAQLNRHPALEATETWASLSGGLFTSGELARMEAEMAGFLRWDLHITAEELEFWTCGEFLQMPWLINGRQGRRKRSSPSSLGTSLWSLLKVLSNLGTETRNTDKWVGLESMLRTLEPASSAEH